MDSVEIFDPNAFTQVKAKLPKGLAGHCLVKLNETLLLAIGGRIGHKQDYDFSPANVGNISDFTFFFDIAINLWSQGPRMSMTREAHACGTVIDPSTGSVNVIVIGGFPSVDPSVGALDSTEVLTIRFQGTNSSAEQWEHGPRLAKSLSYAKLVGISSGSKLLLVGGNGPDGGGYFDSIWVWTCSDNDGGCKQELSGQRFPFLGVDSS